MPAEVLIKDKYAYHLQSTSSDNHTTRNSSQILARMLAKHFSTYLSTHCLRFAHGRRGRKGE